MFRTRVVKPGQWDGMYNKDRNLLLVNFYDPDKNLGKKFVISNAYTHTKKKPKLSEIPVYDDYRVLFSKCDNFNSNLYQCTWPHKHGGKCMLGEPGTESNFAMSSILQNVFNAYYQCTNTGRDTIDFSTNCFQLADEIFAHASTL